MSNTPTTLAGGLSSRLVLSAREETERTSADWRHHPNGVTNYGPGNHEDHVEGD